MDESSENIVVNEVKPSLMRQRLIGGVVFTLLVGFWVFASWLSPVERHDGHTLAALGMPPCGMKATLGVPCMTCGMTTSYTYAAEGNFYESIVSQPAGFMLATATAMATLVSGWAMLSGMALWPIFLSIWRPQVVIPTLVMLILAWGYKIWETVFV